MHKQKSPNSNGIRCEQVNKNKILHGEQQCGTRVCLCRHNRHSHTAAAAAEAEAIRVSVSISNIFLENISCFDRAARMFRGGIVCFPSFTDVNTKHIAPATVCNFFSFSLSKFFCTFRFPSVATKMFHDETKLHSASRARCKIRRESSQASAWMSNFLHSTDDHHHRFRFRLSVMNLSIFEFVICAVACYLRRTFSSLCQSISFLFWSQSSPLHAVRVSYLSRWCDVNRWQNTWICTECL